MAGIGHNSMPSAEMLSNFIERVETLMQERKSIGDDIKEVLAEAKGAGFDTKTIRAIITLRKAEPAARKEGFALLVSYANAVGMDLTGGLA